jgi:hypothetical protein
MPQAASLASVAADLRDRLKASPETSREQLALETLRSVPLADLKDAMTKSTPRERHQLFRILPQDQIQSVLETLPASFLLPSQPPPVAPAPTGGPPASILQTTYENVANPLAVNDPGWSTKISNGQILGVGGQVEWVSVYDKGFEKEGSLNNPMGGLTGWVVAADPPISLADVWFVHPFGNDFQFFIAPDPQYEDLLAATNVGTPATATTAASEFFVATAAARGLGLPAAKGVLGVETDQGLVPPAFQKLVTTGSRIATFGRWIVDCGHNDFHTEIHAPLLMAVATPMPPPLGVAGASEMTSVQFMSRPFTVSQMFAGGNCIDQILSQVAEVETTFLGVPLNWRVEAHPTIFTTPYDGRPFVKLLVQPPPRKHINPVTIPQKLMVNFHFTHRTGVALQVFDAGNGTVGIIIVLGDLTPATLPAKHDKTVQWSELQPYYSHVNEIIDAAEGLDVLVNVAGAFILSEGILTDIYDSPSASSPLDNQNVAGPVAIDQLPAKVGVSEDNSPPQPFPIYGWLNVWWQDEVVSVASQPDTGVVNPQH